MTGRGFGYQQPPNDRVAPAVGVPARAGEPPRPTVRPRDPATMLRTRGPRTAAPPAAPPAAPFLAPPTAPPTAPPVPTGPPGPQLPRGVPAARAYRSGTAAAELDGPGHRLVIGAMVGALVAGALTGLVVGVIAPPSLPAPTVQMAAGAYEATPSATRAAAVPAPRARASAGPRTSLDLRTVQQPQVRPPFDRIESPADNPDLRFVRVEGVWRDQEGRILLRVTPLLSNGRERPGTKPVEVRLSRQATIIGEYYIGDHTNVQPRRFGPDLTHDLLRGALDFGRRPTLWIMRRFVVDGSIVYLQEQAPPENQR